MHTCHAIGCNTPVKPELFMCYRHWKMVPYNMQKEIWRTYRSGQCDDYNPSEEYCNAAKSALIAVAKREGRDIDFNCPELHLYDMLGA